MRLTLPQYLPRPLRRAVLFLPALLVWAATALAAPSDEVWAPLLADLTADGHDPQLLVQALKRADQDYEPRVMAAKLEALLRARRRATQKTEGKPVSRPEFYDRHLNPLILAAGRGFLDLHGATLRKAEQRFGVPRQMQVAILIIETKLGLSLGERPAAATLASMAASRDLSLLAEHIDGYADLDPETRRWLTGRNADKAAWAYRELSALLTLAEASGADLARTPGSPYGAIGLPQFMPTNVLAYGEDGDGDGRVDLFSVPDAVFSLSNFLKRHGWKQDLNEEQRLKVVYRYNHDRVYARTVLEIARQLGFQE